MSTMGYKLQPGVITGPALQELFAYMKSVECALPAVNVINSHGINAALQAAREAQAPIIIQFSHGGGQFYAGKFSTTATTRHPFWVRWRARSTRARWRRPMACR